ncbi:MAG: hypothetical protein NTY75_00150 [Candidatus Shapirobacteria bacterium]|nr:hypothetical protein [Candidatus Shapirobacteria bacterium]
MSATIIAKNKLVYTQIIKYYVYMKILPDKKIFLISYAIAFVVNIGEFGRVDGLPKLIVWLLVDNLIYAILIMIILRIAVWIGKKVGIAK